MQSGTPCDTGKGSSPNPFLFIVGCPRSGTTLLQRIVNAHPEIAVTPETHWIPGFFEKRRGVTRQGTVTSELVSRLLEEPRFTRLQISGEQLEQLIGPREATSYAAFVTGIFDLYGHTQGKRLVGDKTPRYVRSLQTLHALWPRVKFVHLIRNGRDVCLSAMNWEKVYKIARRFRTWDADAVTTVALWWKWLLRLGREAGNSLGPELYYEVRYESLVAHPAKECAALCSFLGVPHDEAMLTFHEGRTRTDPGLDTKDAWLPITPGLRDWKTQMPAQDAERFEAAAGDLLDELGYARAFKDPSRESLSHAMTIREEFAQDIHSQKRVLPQRW